MDGLSALTVAASVAQSIEFGLDLVTKSKEIYKSANGASIKDEETEAATKRLVQLSDRLKTSANDQNTTSGNLSPEDQALQTVCDQCIVVSDELLQKLNKLKVHDQGKLRRYKSFRQAIKSVCSKSAVDEMATRLRELR
jgi:ribosomal protein L21